VKARVPGSKSQVTESVTENKPPSTISYQWSLSVASQLTVASVSFQLRGHKEDIQLTTDTGNWPLVVVGKGEKAG
jgi:hypothetical protein